MLMRLEFIVLSNTTVHLDEHSIGLQSCLSRCKIIFCAPSVPLYEIDDPSQKNGRALINC
jgi:hypothetical protein